MYASFNRFEIQLTKVQAASCSHPGQCDADVGALLHVPKVRRMLNRINPDLIRAELKEYGAWNDQELMDMEQNRARIVWIAANNIMEDIAIKGR